MSNQTTKPQTLDFANAAEERVEGQFRDQINALQAQAACHVGDKLPGLS